MKEIQSNGPDNIISQAIEEMKAEQGNDFSLEKINLAELERRTGISRAKLRRLKENGFVDVPHLRATRVRRFGETTSMKMMLYCALWTASLTMRPYSI